MTVTMKTYEYRNTRNTGTIYVEQTSDLYVWGWSAPMWSVVFHKDGALLARTIKCNLKNKPSAKRIREYQDELD